MFTQFTRGSCQNANSNSNSPIWDLRFSIYNKLSEDSDTPGIYLLRIRGSSNLCMISHRIDKENIKLLGTRVFYLFARSNMDFFLYRGIIFSFFKNKVIRVLISIQWMKNASSNQIKLCSYICHLGVYIGMSYKYLYLCFEEHLKKCSVRTFTWLRI